MMKIINEPLINNINDFDIILFPLGINNAMNRGIAYEIGLNFPEVKASINRTPYCDQKKYGTVHCTKSKGKIFGGCFIHNGGFKKNNNEFIKYDSLKKCLEIIKNNFKDEKIALGVLGAAPEDGNGNKEEILKIIEEVLKDANYTVFDYVQEDFSLKIHRQLCQLYFTKSKGEITMDDYKKELNRLKWMRDHGILNPMPEDYKANGPKKVEKRIRVTKKMLKN